MITITIPSIPINDNNIDIIFLMSYYSFIILIIMLLNCLVYSVYT